MCTSLIVEKGMVPIPGTTTVEAREANIQAEFIILSLMSDGSQGNRDRSWEDKTYNRIKALGAILSVYCL